MSHSHSRSRSLKICVEYVPFHDFAQSHKNGPTLGASQNIYPKCMLLEAI